uniref:uncharacterized protein si:ch211-67f24.7 n=1 Tax=Doryrhamphus excisus TaxID=161450 RepID=UPI0025AE706E|nr:uncharacterized protein si:ch211-67f24.7 [Doryrhamphus excisus]XP_057913003.1 uncharacterized protein si:ch211-67f24.7 [Doryrhamphus excisus]
MKPQEAELVTEISKLQSMVSELRTGLTGAVLDLAHIQHGDSFLREELEENRRRCQKKAVRLEALVESLKEELAVMRCQVLQLCADGRRPPQDEDGSADQDVHPADGRGQCDRSSAGGAWSSEAPCRGKALLHCFLQGLKAGLTEGTDARHQVALQLLHSEWEYVSTLNALYDEYKPTTSETRETFVKLVEQLLQRHLLFRNTLQERLSGEHWKSLVGDILVQLVGQNDTSFSDMYVAYTSTLASFLSLEISGPNPPAEEKQSGRAEKEQIQVLSLLLSPVSRVHCYLSHIQNLLQWTSKEHPDCRLLLGTERALRDVLCRCHVILEEDVRWDDQEGQRCCDVTAGGSSANISSGAPQRAKGETAAQGESLGLTNGSGVGHPLRLECWSCSPVRRKKCLERLRPSGLPPLLTQDTPGWGETSGSGRGAFSRQNGKGASELDTHHGNQDLEEHTTDGDTSALDDSSVTSCSPDGALCREAPEDEEDNQVPVLLKPRQHSERSVCLRWQIPRLTPHPPVRKSTRTFTDGPSLFTSCLASKRLVSVRTGSPPLRANSAFRPIWDDPSKQANPAPEKDHRQGFIPVQTSSRQNLVAVRDNLRPGPGLLAQPNFSVAPPSGTLWDDSEDSEGPCSTV